MSFRPTPLVATQISPLVSSTIAPAIPIGWPCGLIDPAEPAILINGERIVDPDPETAGMIFEESGHLGARQGAARQHQPRTQTIDLASAPPPAQIVPSRAAMTVSISG